ncbi:hypothetical protein F5146DRAFT_67382 [Armillaria mellea]|nr:hypothetical protein F5146DRAFT_67382 [Armillaria mellea]
MRVLQLSRTLLRTEETQRRGCKPSSAEGLSEGRQCRKVDSTTGEVVHPYRLALLKLMYSLFQLYAHLPVKFVHTPHGDIHAKHIHPRYQWMTVPPPRANAGKDRSRAQTYDGTARWNWLAPCTLVCAVSNHVRGPMGLSQPTATERDGKPLAESMFGRAIEMGIPSFFDVVGWIDDLQIQFRVSAYSENGVEASRPKRVIISLREGA